MADLFATGRIVDILLLFVAIEVAVLYALRRRIGLDVPQILANVAAGLFLMLALRVALTGGSWTWIAAALFAALLAHAADLATRARKANFVESATGNQHVR